jgi:O-acetyl-ADP-ribose deacetylase (regulator of RNase III)
VITTAGNLPAKYVIHAVGPVWSGGRRGEADLLRNAYLNSLMMADENRLKSIAFPNISTGIYGYPADQAADIAIRTVVEYPRSGTGIERVVFVCFDPESHRIYHEKLTKLGVV